MKKTIVSVAASTIIATAFTSQSLAATYKVKKGDSLSKIAYKYDTTITHLKEWNRLKSNTIYANQVLTVTVPKASASSVKTAAVKKVTAVKTYKIKSGDTLSGIAHTYKISLKDLLSWNNLKSTSRIYPGQVLKVSKSTTTKTPTMVTKPAASAKADSSKTNYTVKSGDTLSKLSVQFDIKVTDLKKLNGLKSDRIYVGQKLNVGTASSSAPANTKTEGSVIGTPIGSTDGLSATALINSATKLLGIPYVWAGSSLTGFDCSGFIYYVFNQAGVSVPRTSSAGYYSRSFYVTKPQPGDLVFFVDTYQKGISHLGIYLGNNKFIHAGDSGVEISSLDERYWKSHFDGFKRFYESI